jgi:hypothetical protein
MLFRFPCRLIALRHRLGPQFESGSDRLNTQFPILDKHATRYPPLCKIRIRWRSEEAFAGLYGDANLVALSVTRPRVRIRPVDCCHDFFLRPSRRRANECQARKCVNQVSIHHCGRHPRRLSLLFRSWLFRAPHGNDKMIWTDRNEISDNTLDCRVGLQHGSGSPTRFPFHTGAAKKLTFGQSPIITVIGKAFWDVGHAPKDQSNRRRYMPDYAVWEIHPVMKLDVQ